MEFMEERRQKRMLDIPDHEISVKQYNMVMSGLLLYGFLMNALMVWKYGSAVKEWNEILFMGAYIVMIIAGIVCSASNLPLVSFIGYNLVILPIGLFLCLILPGYNSKLILSAALATSAISVVMGTAGVVFPSLFLSMSGTLSFSLIISVLIELSFAIFGADSNITTFIVVIVLSCYIGLDMVKAQTYPKTIDHAIDSTIDLYMDLAMIFIRLIQIFGRRNDD